MVAAGRSLSPGSSPAIPDGNWVGKGDMRAQIQQVGENIKTCLAAAGASLADIVKTNTYVTDFDEFQKHGDMRLRYFGPATPTSTTVEVQRSSAWRVPIS